MSKKDKPLHAKLIANPGAGDVTKAASRIMQVSEYLTGYGFKVDLALARPKREATPIARKAVKAGYDLVIAMGGDGTVGAVISGIAGSKVPLGIIAAGTENDIAASLGIPKDLQQACELIASGNIRKLDLGKISTKKHKKFYFFMVAAVGLTATVYPMIKNVPEGQFSGIKKAVKTLIQYELKPKVYLTLDGESKIAIHTMLVTIANTPLIGLKNLLVPDASLEDGLLDIVVYPNFSKSELLSYFARTANEGLIPDGKIQRFRARKIKVKTSPKLDIAAEGIVLGRGTAKIKVLRRALRVIAPEVGSGAEKPLEKSARELPVAVAAPVAR